MKMNRRINIFKISVLILVLTSCQNIFSKKEVVTKEENKTTTIKIAFNENINGAIPYSLKQLWNNSNNRTANPVVPEGITYTVTAYKGTSQNGTVTYSETSSVQSEFENNAYTIKLTNGIWKLEAEGFISINGIAEPQKVFSGVIEGFEITDSIPSKTAEIDVFPIIGGDATAGWVKLPIKVDSDILSTGNMAELFAEAIYENLNTLTSQKEELVFNDNEAFLYLTETNSIGEVPVGSYFVTLNFYQEIENLKYLIYSTTETVNVFQNLVTDTWERNSENVDYLIPESDENLNLVFHVTKELTDKFQSSILFVNYNTGKDDSSSGSYFNPIKTIQRAIDIIKSKNDSESTFNIYILADYLESNQAASSEDFNNPNEALISIDGNIKVKIKSFGNESQIFEINASRSEDNNGRVIYIAADSSLTLENLSITGGYLMADDSTGVEGAGIYNNGTLNLSGKVGVYGNIKKDWDSSLNAGVGGVSESAIPSNIYLCNTENSNVVNILEPITVAENKKIGITTENKPDSNATSIVFTKDFGASSTKLPDNYFSSDEGYAISYDYVTQEASVVLSGGFIIPSYVENVSFSVDKTVIESKALDINDNETAFSFSATDIKTPRTITITPLLNQGITDDFGEPLEENIEITYWNVTLYDNNNRNFVTSAEVSQANASNSLEFVIPYNLIPGNYTLSIVGNYNNRFYNTNVILTIVDSVNVQINSHSFDTNTNKFLTLKNKNPEMEIAKQVCKNPDSAIVSNVIGSDNTFKRTGKYYLIIFLRNINTNICFREIIPIDCVSFGVDFYFSAMEAASSISSSSATKNNPYVTTTNKTLFLAPKVNLPISGNSNYITPDSYEIQLFKLKNDGSIEKAINLTSFIPNKTESSFSFMIPEDLEPGLYNFVTVSYYKTISSTSNYYFAIHEDVKTPVEIDLEDISTYEFDSTKNYTIKLNNNSSPASLPELLNTLDTNFGQNNNKPDLIKLDLSNLDVTVLTNNDKLLLGSNIINRIVELVLPNSTSTELKQDFFEQKPKNLQKLTIPSSITTLKSYSLRSLKSLSEIIIAEGVQTIETGALTYCNSLSKVVLPSTLQTLGSGFGPSPNLKEFIVSEENTKFKTSEDHTKLLSKDGKTLHSWNCAEGNITKEDFAGIEIIEARAMCGTNITSIEIPNTITRFDTGSSGNQFSYSPNLRYFTFEIGSSIPTIPYDFLNGCSALESITNLPTTITTIGMRAFQNCTSLDTIELPDNIKVIQQDAFYNCTSLSIIDLPETLESIGPSAFFKCTSLNEILIPSKIKSLSANVFNGCTSLSSVYLSENLESIGTSTFGNCSSLKHIYIPAKVKIINQNAFKGCTSLLEISFENTSGQWYYSDSSVPPADFSDGTCTPIDLSDSNQNVDYFTNLYASKYWYWNAD